MNWMFIGDDGDWWCQHCVTHALMFESVPHFPDCPVVSYYDRDATQHEYAPDASNGAANDEDFQKDYLPEPDFPF